MTVLLYSPKHSTVEKSPLHLQPTLISAAVHGRRVIHSAWRLAALLSRRYNSIALQEVRMASILCVDDSPHLVTFYAAMLEALGHAPTTATSTKDGISGIQSNSYDLVITGWNNGD